MKVMLINGISKPTYGTMKGYTSFGVPIIRKENGDEVFHCGIVFPDSPQMREIAGRMTDRELWQWASSVVLLLRALEDKRMPDDFHVKIS